MIKIEYILDKVSEQIKNGDAIIVKSNVPNKKIIKAFNIIGNDYVIVVKKSNKSNLK